MLRGSLDDLDSLRNGVAGADAVIHAGFNHDFSNFAAAAETDRLAIEALGAALADSERPLIVTSGTALATPGRIATEEDGASSNFPRKSEEAAASVAARGARVSVLRLPPSVHGDGDHGFVPLLAGIAREKGVSAYVEDGLNRWPAVHRLDAARLYRLVLESDSASLRYHAIADEGVPFREIAEVIGRHLNLPVVSKSHAEAASHFGWFAHFASLDCPASSALTQQRLGWHPAISTGRAISQQSSTVFELDTRKEPMQQTNLGGSFTFANASLTVNRVGYGAMQLAGPQVWGPPRDPDEAVKVLREAIDAGVNHIDTSDFYGPHVTNRIIRQALHPYPDGLVIVTKVGARRGNDKSWTHARAPQELIEAVHDNLRNLGLDTLDVVNLRVGGVMRPSEGSIEEPLTVLAELQRQGLIRHLGLSNVTPRQFSEGRKISAAVCVQNFFNIVQRDDDAFVDELSRHGVAYVPFFPLGGFTPLQSSELNAIAASVRATPMQVALAWLLHRSPNILLIPGTSSVKHLRENLEAAELELSPETIANLDAIAAAPK